DRPSTTRIQAGADPSMWAGNDGLNYPGGFQVNPFWPVNPLQASAFPQGMMPFPMPEEEIPLGRVEMISEIIQELRSQAAISEPSREVSVSGDVRFPGDYPLVEN